MTKWLPTLLALAPLASCGGEGEPVLPDVSGQVLLLHETGPPVITALDAATGESTTVFEVPSLGFAYELDVHPVTGDIVLAFTPPPVHAEEGWDRSVVAVLDDDATVRPIACDGGAGVWCFFPVWAAHGDRIWFVGTGEGYETDEVGHVLSFVDIAGGEVTQAVEWATEPAVSPDGTQLAWIAVDPATQARSLVLGFGDGDHLRTLVERDAVYDLGQPFFGADGRYVYFVVMHDEVASWWDLLVPSAKAHGVHDKPGDWYRVSVTGGEPERVTWLDTIHYDGATDGRGGLVSATREGVVRVDIESGEATSLLFARTVRALDCVDPRP